MLHDGKLLVLAHHKRTQNTCKATKIKGLMRLAILYYSAACRRLIIFSTILKVAGQ